MSQVDFVAFYDKPRLKFDRLLQTYLAFAPRGFEAFRLAMPLWLREKIFSRSMLLHELRSLDPEADCTERLLFAEHHFSHAASAFYPSPFFEAAVLTLDGVGEWATTSMAVGRGNSLQIAKELHFPHSLGLLYSAFTYYTGFKVNSGEYKLMGLAPYGEPRYAKLIFDNLIDLKDDGTFRLDLSYFDYCTGLKMTNEKFDALFGGPPKRPDALLTQREMDLAASIQVVTEEVILRLTNAVAAETGLENLCMAGGVALNCVANGKVLHNGTFKRVWVQPAAGDAGGALGAALAVYHVKLGRERPDLNGRPDFMCGAYLGPSFAQRDIERRLTGVGARYSVQSERELIENHAPKHWREARQSGGFRAAWNSDRVPLARARSSATRALRRCNRSSTSRSNTGNRFARSRRLSCARISRNGSNSTSIPLTCSS